ncbi:ATP-binding protein [Lentzea sp. NPDC102401]|uniref:ATP-binding protein n=1 Tax=Lentzea sp. NPDC102401 TaxID=3364128 RepID=UPI003802B12E
MTTAPTRGLPADTTSFVGRADLVEHTRELVARERLVSLTGPGGVGKTRLAVRVASTMTRAFTHGVYLADLRVLAGDPGTDLAGVDASAGERAVVAPLGALSRVVADALNLRDHSDKPVIARLLEHVRDRQLLLVLDNCEHVVHLVRRLVAVLLREAPELKILTTSQHRLGGPDEHHVPVEPLACPDPGSRAWTSEAAHRSEAISLFRERSAAAGHRIAEDELKDVARLCMAFGSLPLNIELIAGTMSTYSPATLLARREELIRQGRFLQPVEWSYENCDSDAERLLWRRLSVFSGAFDLDAAEAVACTDVIADERVLSLIGGEEAPGASAVTSCEPLASGQVFDLIENLVHHSVLSIDRSTGKVRYRLLETLQAFGARRLAESGEDTTVRLRHLLHCRDRVVEVAQNWLSPKETVLLDQLRLDMPDVRAAMSFALSAPRAAMLCGLEVSTMLTVGRAWFFFGSLSEGRDWQLRFLGALTDVPSALHAIALTQLYWIGICQGRVELTDERFKEVLALAEATRDPFALASYSFLRGTHLLLGTGEPEALQWLERATAEFDAAGDPTKAFMPRMFAAVAASLMHDDPDLSLRLATEVTKLAEESQSAQSVGWARFSLAMAFLQRGEHARARILAQEGLRIQRDIGDLWGPSWSLDALSWTTADDRPELAAELAGAADSVRRDTGAQIERLPALAAQRTRAMATIRVTLSAPACATAYARGAALPPDQAIEFGISVFTAEERDFRPVDQAMVELARKGVTEREREVALLVEQGLTNPQIGARLHVGSRTVETHVRSLLRKLGLTSRTQVAACMAASRVPAVVTATTPGADEDRS